MYFAFFNKLLKNGLTLIFRICVFSDEFSHKEILEQTHHFPVAEHDFTMSFLQIIIGIRFQHQYACILKACDLRIANQMIRLQEEQMEVRI